MSKERELLKRFMTELTTEEDVVSLFNDIKECLIQPEQDQKPLSESEIASIWGDSDYDVTVVRRIEKAHGIGD